MDASSLVSDLMDFESASRNFVSPVEDIISSQLDDELTAGVDFKTQSDKVEDVNMKSPSVLDDSGDSLFTFHNSNKKITMIPIKYKLKEERRKVIKISLNKLKKIDDPESSLRRSVLINNTMKKLQKEAREEKLQKQINTYTRSCFLKTSNDEKTIEYNYELSKRYDWKSEPREEKHSKIKLGCSNKIIGLDVDKQDLIEGLCLNEDVVDHIPSIKRCSSRKKSLDEDGSASEVLNLNEMDKKIGLDDVEECDEVHDVLSQLYLPPTPRMLTSIDSDTDDEEFQHQGDNKRKLEQYEDNCVKKIKKCEDYNCDLMIKYNKENYRTNVVFENGENNIKNCDDELLQLEDIEDVEKRLSETFNNYKKNENNKTKHYYDESSNCNHCDSQYSCGHSIMFNDIQSVSFHNLITSLET